MKFRRDREPTAFEATFKIICSCTILIAQPDFMNKNLKILSETSMCQFLIEGDLKI